MADKAFDTVLRLAFDRGAEFGSRYPEFEAIPEAERDDHYVRHVADHLAARDRRVRAEALREAAEDCDHQVLAAPFSRASLGPWLRARADRIEGEG